MPVRAFIIDDSDAMVRSLSDFLKSLSGVAFAGSAASGPDGVAACRQIQPDLVLVDFAMPGMNGFEAALRIRRSCPSCRVVIVSQYCRLLANAGPWPEVEAVIDKLEVGFELPELIARLFPAP
jgi:DNA-binding NarL/FixJ family response regulator